MARRSMHYYTSRGWIQDQHGAWPMALVPILFGASAGGWLPIHVLLVVCWLAGFHLFNVGSLWLKARSSARRRQRYEPALCVWAVITAVSGLVLVGMMPQVLWWAVFFAPLIAVAVWESWQKNERALLARATTILASCLTLPMAAWISNMQAAGTESAASVGLREVWWEFLASLSMPGLVVSGVGVWVVTAFLAAYFLATVPYVRSLIRGRHDHRWMWGSVCVHAIVAAVMTVLFWWGLPWATWLLVLVWSLLTVRAWLLPLAQRRHLPIRPAHIGIGEFVSTAAVLVTLWLALLS